jgi:serine/threonine-protein kinase
MSIDSVDTLLTTLRQNRLCEPTQLDELTGALQPRFADPRALARELVQRGWLTPYQVNQLFLGNVRQLVLGQYVLLEKLGEGGMGTVFKARHLRLGRNVAVKVIRKDKLTGPDAVLRFQREARAAAMLSHPHIVTVHDADEVGGTSFYVMEYVEGRDLARVVEKKGPLPVGRACACAQQAALGLQHAHEQGMVHRDIKPHNLLVAARGGQVKILDMGLARVDVPAAGAAGALTLEGAVMGTPDFLAPEQAIDAHSVDIRADIYSLGCTLYFLLTGQPPFVGGSLAQKLAWHLHAEPQPIEDLRRDVPPALAAVVRKMMAKKPGDRYATPAEVALALAPFTDQSPSGVVAALAHPVPLATAETEPNPGELDSAKTVEGEAAAAGQGPTQPWPAGPAGKHASAVTPEAPPWSGHGALRLATKAAARGGLWLAQDWRRLAGAAAVVLVLVVWAAWPSKKPAPESEGTAPAPVPPEPVPPAVLKSAKEYVLLGKSSNKARNYKQAINDFTAALKLDPRNFEAFANRALAHKGLGNHAAAVADCDAALKEEDHLAVLVLRGECYCYLKDYEKALRDLDRAVQKDPNNAEAWATRGLVYLNMDRHDDAIRDLDKALDLDPKDDQSYFFRAQARRSKKDFEGALQDYGRAIDLNRKAARYFLYRGGLHRTQKRLDEALQDLNEALQLDGNNPAVYRERAAVYGDKGDPENARKDLEKANRLEANP